MVKAQETNSRGFLQVNVVNIQNNFPIKNATISISTKGEPDRVMEEVSTNSSGQTEQLSLPAPPVEYSLNPGIIQPYSEYDLIVRAEGFEPLAISGTEILADSNAIQPAAMTPLAQEQPPEDPALRARAITSFRRVSIRACSTPCRRRPSSSSSC